MLHEMHRYKFYALIVQMIQKIVRYDSALKNRMHLVCKIALQNA